MCTTAITADSRNFPHTVMILIIVCAGAFHLATIQSGHNWGGDFALYITHAKNIATLQPYDDTNWIANPHVPELSPGSYPPIFPLIISPLYSMYGLELYPMKVLNVILFMLFLGVFAVYCTRRLNHLSAQIATVAMVGFSPWFWDMRNDVLSETTFVLFLYSSFFLLDRLDGPIVDESRYKRVAMAVLAGLSVYLAYGTRSAGLLIMPVFVMADLFRHRTLRGCTIMVVTVFVASYLAQGALLKVDSSYLQMLASMTFHSISPNIRQYAWSIAGYWHDSALLIGVIGSLCSFGYFRSLRRDCSAEELFLPLYMCLIALWPSYQGPRFLLPVAPLLALYIFRGAEGLWLDRAGLGRLSAVPLISALVVYSYLVSYSTRELGDMTYGIKSPESAEMLQFIHNDTPADSLILFRKPRVLALYTRRTASAYHLTQDIDELWHFIRTIRATHIVVKHLDRGYSSKDGRTFPLLLDRYEQNLRLIFENAEFRVYRVEIRGSRM